MSTNPIHLHRILAASPERVFKAFSDVAAYATWLPPYGFIAKIQQYDFKPGGSYKMSFQNFGTGSEQHFGGEFLEIRENELIRATDRFDDSHLPGEMVTSIEFKKVICGTEIKITQTGIPEAIPIEMCYLGWQDSLDKLKRLVEPNIPDA
ncbi:MAG: SRPBCC family protein [Chitinophagaceae bacterium]|nr:SRPBCC family protein [Bacteroidota bacterium]MCC6257362.1 SRPBCC family protein [Chitinophagaceae bacterium]MCW5917271.1 SRPBCC family protein [Ferruginibacter sp.]